MQVVFTIPKEFESHFNKDRFADSLARVASDIEQLGFKLSGRYEKETITMIREGFENSVVLPDGHGRLIDADAEIKRVEETMGMSDEKYGAFFRGQLATLRMAEVVVEADREGVQE